VIKRRQTGPVSVYALNSYSEKNPKKRGQEILFAIDNCQPYQLKERFLRDVTNILYSLKNSELEDFNWGLLPKQLKREFDEIARERAKQEKCA
jgi:hypothetical protein